MSSGVLTHRLRGWSRSLLPAAAVVVLVLASVSAGAHFLLNLNVRILHIEHLSDGLRVYLRTPMPYLVADKVGPAQDGGLPEPAPFTTNANEDGRVVHYVDLAEVAGDPLAVGQLAEDGFVFESAGMRLRGAVEDVRIYRVGTEPGFATLDEARAAFSPSAPPPDIQPPLYVGDAVLDVVLRYTPGTPVSSYSVASTLDPGLPDQENTANLILDYGPGEPRVYRSRGLLRDPVEVTRSTWSAIATFIWEGVRHILEGVDHVLFVVCLVIGATALRSLVWRVTGFTLGHSVTLALGFFGYVPRGDWFVPTVETGIAVSIIYAAAIAVWPRRERTNSERQMFVVTCAIGLLHGLGFSFVLKNILQIDSPNIWQSLLTFNVGVEIGQLLIVLAVWPLLLLLRRINLRLADFARVGAATACAAIAVIWTVQRIGDVFSQLG